MLTVGDLMTHSPHTVAPEASLHDALMLMNKDGCRHLPVLEANRLVGIITERDIRLAVNSPVVWDEHSIPRSEVLHAVKVDVCMTPEPTTVSPDTSAFEAASVLRLNQFGALPVVQDDALIGIISVSDFLDYVISLGKSG
jgi:acetoin utilization protein AcuB